MSLKNFSSQPLPSSPCHKERLHLSPNLPPQAGGLTAPPRRSYTKVGGASKPSPDCFMQLGLPLTLYQTVLPLGKGEVEGDGKS